MENFKNVEINGFKFNPDIDYWGRVILDEPIQDCNIFVTIKENCDYLKLTVYIENYTENRKFDLLTAEKNLEKLNEHSDFNLIKKWCELIDDDYIVEFTKEMFNMSGLFGVEKEDI